VRRHHAEADLTMQYDVVFEVALHQGGPRKTVRVDIPDSKNEETNKVRAITSAAMALDSDGIKHWSLKACAKATS
jgi:hypothetical protein